MKMTRNRGQSPRDDYDDGLSRGFFPTVAWPSEAVRVGDESIAFIHKRVEDPFYGPTRHCSIDQIPDEKLGTVPAR